MRFSPPDVSFYREMAHATPHMGMKNIRSSSFRGTNIFLSPLQIRRIWGGCPLVPRSGTGRVGLGLPRAHASCGEKGGRRPPLQIRVIRVTCPSSPAPVLWGFGVRGESLPLILLPSPDCVIQSGEGPGVGLTRSPPPAARSAANTSGSHPAPPPAGRSPRSGRCAPRRSWPG
jgi:hypothetical protein